MRFSLYAKARRSSLVAGWILISTLAAPADVKIERPWPDTIKIFITGTIAARDAKEFEDIDEELQRKGVTVSLNSLGGDVSAAIRIGRIVRKSDGMTYIGDPNVLHTSLPLESKCYSSCALIFIAGVRRTALQLTELGLHRPFLATAPQSREAIEKQVPQMLSMVKSYVSEMSITDLFYQQMVNTEPSRMVIYKDEQYKKIIPEYDPVYEETEIAREARGYGLTTVEMRKRKQEAENTCNGMSDWERSHDCHMAIRWGLSVGVYRERFQKTDVCYLSREERASLWLVPKRIRSENPLILREEDCIRDIMLGRQ